MPDDNAIERLSKLPKPKPPKEEQPDEEDATGASGEGRQAGVRYNWTKVIFSPKVVTASGWSVRL